MKHKMKLLVSKAYVEQAINRLIEAKSAINDDRIGEAIECLERINNDFDLAPLISALKNSELETP